MTFKYSPNNSKNMTDDDKRLDINNIFGFNRLGTTTSVEGGSSITYGLDYLNQISQIMRFLARKLQIYLDQRKMKIYQIKVD